MKKNLFLAGAAALVLASCVNEQLVEGGGSFSAQYGDDAISVRTFVGNSTKAGVVGIDSLQANGFLVYAQHNQGGTQGAGDVDVPTTGSWNTMTKKYVTWNSDATKLYWEYSPIEYWPFGGTVDFYAYSIPGTKMTNSAGTEVIDSDYDTEVTVGLDGVTEFSTRVLLDEQIDLLAGAAIDATKESSYLTNGVSFNFQHILSRIGFRAKAQSDFDVANYDIVVNSLEIFYNTSAANAPVQKGTFDITLTDENVASQPLIRNTLWATGAQFAADGTEVVYDVNTTGILTMDDDTGIVSYARAAEEDGVTTKMVPAGYPFTLDDADTNNKLLTKSAVTITEHDTTVALTGKDGYIMIIPQTYTGSTGAINETTGVYEDDMTASFYAQVVFTAVKKGQAAADAAANGTWTKMTYVKNVALPLVKQTTDGSIPDGFNPGKTYTFEMELGLDAIVFSTQIGVDEWVPATGEGSVEGEDGYHTEDDYIDGNFGEGDPVIVGALTTKMTTVSASALTETGSTGLYETTLSWATYTPADDEVNTGFRIEWTAGTGSHTFTHAMTVYDADATGATITGLDGALDYTIVVVAIGAPSQYGYSQAADAVTVDAVL